MYSQRSMRRCIISNISTIRLSAHLPLRKAHQQADVLTTRMVQLHEQLGPGLVELRHPRGQVAEHLLVLIQPAAAHRIAHALHARQHQAHVLLRALEDVICRLLVKMARLQPSEQGCSSHGSLNDPVRYLYVPDLPRRE